MRLDKRWRTLFAADVVTEKEGILQRGYEVKASSEPIDQFWSHVDPLAVAMTAAQRALLMLEASPCPAGRMPVILAGEAGGTMVHEACGHGLEADSVQKDYSIYRDRLGAAVASPLVTLVDDATLKGPSAPTEWTTKARRPKGASLWRTACLSVILRISYQPRKAIYL